MLRLLSPVRKLKDRGSVVGTISRLKGLRESLMTSDTVPVGVLLG